MGETVGAKKSAVGRNDLYGEQQGSNFFVRRFLLLFRPSMRRRHVFLENIKPGRLPALVCSVLLFQRRDDATHAACYVLALPGFFVEPASQAGGNGSEREKTVTIREE